MKKNLIILIALTCLLYVLYSCSDNNIYFDINSQSVVTCNKKAIKKLCISSTDGKDFYFFSKLPKVEGTNKFILSNLSRNYLLENVNREVSIDSFELRPETSYKIENSTFGDAASSEIQIKTDKGGKVIYSSITSCK